MPQKGSTPTVAGRGTVDIFSHQVGRELTVRERYIATTAWEIGRAYGHREVAEAIEEARKLPIPKPARRTLEQQISDRLAEFDALARAYYERTGRREWLGTDNLDEVKPWT